MTKLNWKRIFIALSVFFAVIAGLIFISASIIIIKYDAENQLISLFDEMDEDDYGYYDEEYVEEDYQDYCSVMGIMLNGELTTYAMITGDESEELVSISTSADDILWAINDAEKSSSVSAIILEISSYGGSAVAGEEIANALKKATKPTVVVIRDGAASSAYLAATGADYIIASPLSDVGSIGITASHLNYTKQNEEQGITYIELNSGKFKDTGDPDKIITEEEKALWQRDIDIMYRYFIDQVAQNRGLEVDKVTQLADGSTVLGQMALDNGLIDTLGSHDEAIKYLIDKKAITNEQDICWY
ncbi:MAG: signal peptide peptidase SppA [Candidatus Komeilibacteria bacterium]|jgi:signal peptide peptidase SppA|nr:signal peptide peptidase SppA [Candidatus Komeilibacteria bacterium]MBT4447749.1 signal peptide peptidase SppA [Candidatus Komeilibacteria bacterium]